MTDQAMIERVAKAWYEDWLSEPSVVEEARRNGPHPAWEKLSFSKDKWLHKARVAIQAMQETAP